MINGAHIIIYSKDAEADRRFFKEIMNFKHVDVGEGWLVFALPPSEVAVHPEKKAYHEFYLMCENINSFVADMKKHKVSCSAIADHGWGLLTEVRLPGGGKLGVYEPRHARP